MNTQELELIDKYNIEDILENIELYDVEFYLVAAHTNGFIFFTKGIDDFKINEAINKVIYDIGLSREQVLIIQNRNDTYYYLYLTGNKELIPGLENAFDDLIKGKKNKLEAMDNIDVKNTIEKDKIPYYLDDLIAISKKTIANKKIKEYEDGTVMIKTSKNEWEVASNEDSLVAFKETIYGGFLGINKFKERKFIDGFLYILTGGLFCLGYIEDLIPFWCDTKRDSEGKLYIPISNDNKKKFIIPQIVMLVIDVIYCMILFYIIGNIR